MIGRSLPRSWFALIALALLGAIAVHGIGSRPSFAEAAHGSAFNAYSSAVAIVAPRFDGAPQQGAVSPTPVPPLATVDDGFQPDEAAGAAADRTLPQGRAPPRLEAASSHARPRGPPIT